MDPTHWLDEGEQQLSSEALRTGLAMSGLDVDALWSQCVALGSIPGGDWLEAVLDGTRARTAHEHDLVAQALNDHFVADQGDHPVRYATDLTDDVPSA